MAVHPHACGEHVIGMDAKYPDAGSSPRLWGTRFIAAAHIISLRFIPTPVGNTHQLHIQLIAPPVHPHACGEHEDQMKTVKSLIGSSPRLWGTRRPDEDSEKPDRFIPTPVGNTQPLRGSLTALRFIPTPVGNTLPTSTQKPHFRFIPTPVGNTSRGTSPCGTTPVHPHACGEHNFLISSTRP